MAGARVIYAATIVKESAQPDEIHTDEIPRPGNDYDLIEYYSSLTGWNAYHARALRVKTDVTVNNGFTLHVENEKEASERLQRVNDRDQSFQEVIARAWMDYESCGNGYIEIVRSKNGMVAEMYHCPATMVYLRPRSAPTDFVFRNSAQEQEYMVYRPGARDEYSLLHFSNYTHDDLYYGLPDWRGCKEDIELDYYCALYNKRFFINSGVPDLAIITEGGKFDKDTEKRVVEFLTSNLKGVMNSHRTLYLPVDEPGVKVRIEKIAYDKDKDGSFERTRSRCRDNIISAHGVPPRLMGVMSASQLGGGSEVEGQLRIFQEITINPRQSYAEGKLAPVIREMGFATAELKFNEIDTDYQEKRSDYYTKLLSSGIITKDEARQELGYQPMSGVEKSDQKQVDILAGMVKLLDAI